MKANVLRLAAALCLAGLVLSPACLSGGDDAGPGIDPVERLDESVELALKDPDGSERLFFSMTCDDNILTIVTTFEVVRAELPCDRAPKQEQIELYLGEPVTLLIEPGDGGKPGKLFVLQTTGASFEFTVGAVSLLTAP